MKRSERKALSWAGTGLMGFLCVAWLLPVIIVLFNSFK